jgi:hypothetical protein
MTRPKVLVPMAPRVCGPALLWLGAAILCFPSSGCGPKVAPPEPDAKVRLTKLLRLYQVYVTKNRQGPSGESALREFGQKLSTQQRDEYLIGDDLESIFTSPRDNQKYVVRYNLRLNPSASARAVAWEANGYNGKRYVALSIGYVEEYDEQTFKEYSK